MRRRGGLLPAAAPGPPRSRLTVALMSMALIMEKADEQVLPAVYLAMGSSLAATPAQLGAITLARALAQAAASPFAGALGDACDRVAVVAAGCGLWAACTAGIAAAPTVAAMVPLAALNGVGLALAIPCVQSIVADAVAPSRRGSAFGFVGTAAGLGGMAAAWGATAAARTTVAGGVPGWRAAFGAVAALSAAVGGCVLCFARDPRLDAAAAAAAGRPLREVALTALPPPSPGRPAAGGGLMKQASLASSAGGSGRFAWALPASAAGRDEEAAPLLVVAATPPPSPGRAGGGCGGGGGAAAGLTNGKEPGHHLRVGASIGSAAGLLAAEAAAAARGGTTPASAPLRRSLRRAAAAAGAVLRVRSFRVLVAQGVVGSMPWQALLYSTLWLQLVGFPDATAGGLSALFAAACAAGGLLGGALGDAAARAWPDGGRVAVSQASVAAGLPLAWLLLRGVPGSAACVARTAAAAAAGGGGGTGVFAGNAGGASAPPGPACASAVGAVLAVTGVLISWCGANNSAIFAEVVPEHLRSTVYAFDRAFEGAVAATATPLVGWLAQAVFGFGGDLSAVRGADAGRARALGSALLVLTCVPWAACWCAYLLLYRAYPPDRRRAARAAAAAAGGAAPATPLAPPPLSPPPVRTSASPFVDGGLRAHDDDDAAGASPPPTPRLLTLEDAYALVMAKKETEAAAAAAAAAAVAAAGGSPAAAPPPTPPPGRLGSGASGGGRSIIPLSRAGASLPRTPVRRGGSGGGGHGGGWGAGAPSPARPAGGGLDRAPSAPTEGWAVVASPRAARRRSLDLLRRF